MSVRNHAQPARKHAHTKTTETGSDGLGAGFFDSREQTLKCNLRDRAAFFQVLPNTFEGRREAAFVDGNLPCDGFLAQAPRRTLLPFDE